MGRRNELFNEAYTVLEPPRGICGVCVMGWNKFFGRSGRKRANKKSGQPHSGHRPVRFEQMEQRTLLSVSPASPPAGTTDLGHVDYREVEAADQTYQLITRYNGTLTAQLEGTGNVELYDDQYNLISSASRVDQAVSEGETYFVTLTGTTTGEDLWIANLVDASTADLLVHGTNHDDEYQFDWTVDGTEAIDFYELGVNSISYTFAVANVDSIDIDAGSGHDRRRLGRRNWKRHGGHPADQHDAYWLGL
jgi:hypothetical protein